MEHDHTQKLDNLHQKILSFDYGKIRTDLTRMYNGCLKLQTQLSIEMVNCRRLHKLTPKYLELSDKLEQQLQNLDYYLVFGILSKD